MALTFALIAGTTSLIALGCAATAWRVHSQKRKLEQHLTQARSEGLQARAAMEQSAVKLNEVETAQADEAKLRHAAQAAETHLQTLLDSLDQPIWCRGPDLRLRFCNATYLRVVDASREAVLNEGIELVDGSDREAAMALAREAHETREVRKGRFHVVAHGRRCLMEITEQPLADGGLMGHARDLTAIEDLEADLARHIGTHRAVLEQLSVGIAILGSDMHLRFHNHACALVWGIDESFLSSEPHITDVLERLRELRRLPEQADFTEYKRRQLRLYQTLIEPSEELSHLPDGTTLRTTVHPHPFGGVILTIEDVTDRLRLERTYNTLLDVQRETLDNLYEGIAVYGADGRLKLFNPAFARIWGLPEDFLRQKPHVREIVQRCRPYFDVEEGAWENYSELVVVRATEPQANSGRRERADGSVLEWAQVPLPDGASLFSFIDVTDSSRVELALRERNEALETIDRLKSEFIANVSYELRTPLNAIIGFAEILQNRYFGELNTRQAEYSQGIVESSQHLIALINDILDLASIEAGYLQLDRKSVDLYALLSNVQNLWRERARTRGLHLELECPPDLGALFCDERRLTQAIFNLLSNAFKFTPEGGTIALAAERDAQSVRLIVRDTGIGIPPKDQARVLARFERGGRRQPGAGLGLSLVKSLIELHGGWIELHSEPDSGTTVTCHLPAGEHLSHPALPAARVSSTAG